MELAARPWAPPHREFCFLSSGRDLDDGWTVVIGYQRQELITSLQYTQILPDLPAPGSRWQFPAHIHAMERAPPCPGPNLRTCQVKAALPLCVPLPGVGLEFMSVPGVSDSLLTAVNSGGDVSAYVRTVIINGELVGLQSCVWMALYCCLLFLALLCCVLVALWCCFYESATLSVDGMVLLQEPSGALGFRQTLFQGVLR